MSKKQLEKKKIIYSYQKYKKEIEREMSKPENRRRLREGIEPLNLEEYTAQFYVHQDLYAALEADGKIVPMHKLILDDMYATSDRVYNGLQKLLYENGYKVSMDAIKMDGTKYFNFLRSMYPDDETYDMAISEASGW